MKAKKPKAKPGSPPPAAAEPNPSSVPARTPELPARKRRWFALAALGMPLLLLALVEVLLRLFGFGYATGFFRESRIQGRPVLIENIDFTRRFFPPGLARTPEPLVMPAQKAADTCRIFIFGESAALGDPAPAYGFGRILETLLRARFPSRRFEVVNVAVTAINSHVVREIARDCARRQGDLWVIYMGNNEVVGPFGAGTVFNAQAPSLGVIRANLAFQRLRIGQLVTAARWRFGRGKTPARWEGMEMFLDQQVRQNDPRMATVYAHFAKNLEDILEGAARSGTPVVLSTVASNLKDSPPFASLHRVDLGAGQLAEWNRLYASATNHEAAGEFAGAVEGFAQATRLDDQFAELHYRMGRCHLARSNYADARKSFERARDLDTLRFRIDSRLNEIIRVAATNRAGRQFRFVDCETVLAARSPHQITGEEFIYEHVHPNFAGNYEIARALAEQVVTLLPAGMVAADSKSSAWLTADECGRRLAYTDWDRLQIETEMVKRLELPPFSNQLGHLARLDRLRQACVRLESKMQPAAYDAAVSVYRQAVIQAPEDWMLHEHFAKLAEAAGEAAVAEEQWRKVIALLPHHVQPYYSLANLLDSRGRSAEAIPLFLEALRRSPGLVEARNGLALALSNLGRTAEALKHYNAALQRKPEFAEARVNLGQLLAREGNTAAARAQYELALRYNSNSVAAHVNLGNLLSSDGQTADAIAHYRTALRLKPDNAVGHYNLGNALTAQNDPAALAQYAEAVRLKPDFAEARYQYGLWLTRQARLNEALTQFEEAVRLKPGFAAAHLNLGVALAKLRRFPEAITQFQEVLRLEPNHEAARKYLEQAQHLKPRE